MDGPSTPFESLIQGLLNRCTGGDAAELKAARQKMGKPEQKDIYWENCQSYGVNLSLGGCHLVDKESLANKSYGDNDDDDGNDDDGDNDDDGNNDDDDGNDDDHHNGEKDDGDDLH